MKKIICLVVAVLLTVGILTCTAFANDVPPEEIPAEDVITSDLILWIKENVMPDLISFLTVAGVGLVYLLPAIAKVKKASGVFGTSASTIDRFVDEAAKREINWEAEKEAFIGMMQEALEDLKTRELESEEKIRCQMEALESVANSFANALKESEEHLAKTLSHVEQMSDKTERMVYLGLTNTPALAGNGTARKIAEVEEEQ